MEHQPKKFIIRILEFAALFALSAFLMRLGVAYLREIWLALIIIGVVAGAAVIGYRVWKNRTSW